MLGLHAKLKKFGIKLKWVILTKQKN
jgi:hypothetical protein